MPSSPHVLLPTHIPGIIHGQMDLYTHTHTHIHRRITLNIIFSILVEPTLCKFSLTSHLLESLYGVQFAQKTRKNASISDFKTLNLLSIFSELGQPHSNTKKKKRGGMKYNK